MKADDANLLELLHKSRQFVVPIYQRLYSWGEPECAQLWKDILRAGSVDGPAEHFTGSIVYVEKAEGSITNQQPNLIIDGQQRVTTVTLLLTALAERLSRVPEGDWLMAYDGFKPDKIRAWYLMDPFEEGEGKYKLLLSQRDRETLISIVNGVDPDPANASPRLVENYGFFRDRLNDPACDLTVVCRGLDRLKVVDIRLTRGLDNPQLVFESMNSTGKKLSQTDLIRNYVLMDLPNDEQENLYMLHWRPMEQLFGNMDEQRFDEFMRDYLTMCTRDIPRLDRIYDAFRDYADDWRTRGHSVRDLVVDLHEKSDWFASVALGRETEPRLHVLFDELRDLQATVSRPMLLECYGDYKDGLIDSTAMARIVELVISYVFRRAVCMIPTNSLNKTFATFTSGLGKDPGHYLEDIEVKFALMENYRRFPSDEEFIQALEHNDLYHFKRRMYLFDKLENDGAKERAQVTNYTIEHIMPQNPELSENWRDVLGPDWRNVQKTWLHTLGNLTLTGYNSEMSDHDFGDKRDGAKGFRFSPLRLNEGLGQLDCWNEEEIKRRGERLARRAVAIWRAPQPSTDAIDRYHSEHGENTKSQQTGYTIENDHPELVDGPLSELFHRIDGTIRSWDPHIERRPVKLYVGYHHNQMFVSVIPRRGRLVIGLVMPYEHLRDERNLAEYKAVQGWGGTRTEVTLYPDSSEDDINYVLGLARQSYEDQLDE